MPPAQALPYRLAYPTSLAWDKLGPCHPRHVKQMEEENEDKHIEELTEFSELCDRYDTDCTTQIKQELLIH